MTRLFPAPPPPRLRAGLATLALVLPLAACSGGSDGADRADDPAGATPTSSASPSTDAPSSDPSGTPGSGPTPVDVPERVRRQAEAQVRAYADRSTRVLGDPTTADRSLREVAAGAALADLRATAEEYAANGWRVTGRPEVVSASVVRRRADPPRLRVLACVDSSDVRVVSATTGDPVGSATAAGRSRTITDLERRDDRWVVVATSFPADPDC